MSNTILVTYASRLGATAGVAEAIGKTLTDNGAQVEVRRMEEVTDLTPYSAVVAGSAIRDKQWLPEAMQFMRTHQAALRQKPFAAFLVCMTLATLAPTAWAQCGVKDGEKYRPQVAAWLDPVRSLVKPVSEGLFAGVLDIGQISSFSDRLKFRVSVLVGVWQEGDHRDWNAIREWAARLRAVLLP
jgi:menaquinone-dependent protoporphyrinogen oxidase